MKVTLVQLDARARFSVTELERRLRDAPPSDLVVFPEGFPFNNGGRLVSHRVAVNRLEGVAKKLPTRTFIAGGDVTSVVRNGPMSTYNRNYLVTLGQVDNKYDKQIDFKNESIKLGRSFTLFRFDAFECLPLICADAGQGEE